MDLDLEEQEQLANLKAFWQDYGRWLSLGILLAILGSALYWLYGHYQDQQALNASKQYEMVLQSASANNLPDVLAKTQKIQSDYPRTAYAGMAGLLAANLAIAVNDKPNTITQLDWVAQHAKSESLAMIAKLRLVTILIDQNTSESLSKADTLLKDTPAHGFEALQLERRGDWHWAQNHTAEAKKSYIESWNVLSAEGLKGSGKKELDPALQKLQQQNPAPEQRLLKIKIDSLGGF
jgi:predicted negative regulator of RcsB-dependent stress response